MAEIDGLTAGIDDLVFARHSHREGEEIALALTPQFKRCWKEATDGQNYQRDFMEFVAMALDQHYRENLKRPKGGYDTDRVTEIGAVILSMKEVLFDPQTSLLNF